MTEVSFFDPCVFVGSGADIARYATAPLVDPALFHKVGLTLDESILLATHALRVAKQNDVYCGGRSHFAVLYDNGTRSDVAQSEINAMERYSETLKEF